MDFLTTNMVRRYCCIESYNPDPYRQAEIDNKIVTAANKAEQEVYAIIGKNYSDIINEYGQVPLLIEQVALIFAARGFINLPYEDGTIENMLLQIYKKQTNNK